MSRLGRLLVFATACVLAGPAHWAHARWPTPAAGPSRSGDPEILFTFDDGPNPATTDRVLDILDARDIDAMFFMVGWRVTRGAHEKSTASIARMLREGHVLANHTMSHAELCRVTEDEAATEIDAGRAALERAAQMPLNYFRTPYGAHCQRLLDQLAARGTAHFHWDIDPQEWKHPSVEHVFTYVTNKLRRLDGRAVILMHDTKVATVGALPKILDWLDVENARRATEGRRPIRILRAAEVISEQIAPPVRAVATVVADGALASIDAFAQLVP